MRVVTASIRSICGVVLLVVGWAIPAHAQLGVGTTWQRTDPLGLGLVLVVSACCNGGLRLVYTVPPMGGQPAATMTVDSPMDGTEVPVLLGGKPSGQTMAIKRLNDHHFTAIGKMGGGISGTYNSTVSADGRSMTVESVVTGTGAVQKITETWVRK